MALDKTRVKTAIVDRIEADYSITFDPAQRIQAEKIWNLVVDEIFKEIKTYGELQLLAQDINVDPGTFTAGITPVTGVGTSQAVTLTGRIE